MPRHGGCEPDHRKIEHFGLTGHRTPVESARYILPALKNRITRDIGYRKRQEHQLHGSLQCCPRGTPRRCAHCQETGSRVQCSRRMRRGCASMPVQTMARRASSSVRPGRLRKTHYRATTASWGKDHDSAGPATAPRGRYCLTTTAGRFKLLCKTLHQITCLLRFTFAIMFLASAVHLLLAGADWRSRNPSRRRLGPSRSNSLTPLRPVYARQHPGPSAITVAR